MASPSAGTTKEAPGVLEQSHVTFSGELCTFFFFFKGTLFIYLFWLCWVFASVRGLSLVAVRGLLIAVASLVAEHRL